MDCVRVYSRDCIGCEIMTEKRFTVESDDSDVWDRNHFIGVAYNHNNAVAFVDLLNEQHEEIKELQRHLDVMRSGALSDDKRIKELYDENEQLKKTIKTICEDYMNNCNDWERFERLIKGIENE